MAFSTAFLVQLSLIFLSINTISALPSRRHGPEATSVQVPLVTLSIGPNTGTLPTCLETVGHGTALPFPTTTITSPLPALNTPLLTPKPQLASNSKINGFRAQQAGPVDPFLPVTVGPAPTQIPAKANHPVPRLNIGYQANPIHTNKFYANFFLGDQGSGTWTHPYSLTWSKGGGPVSSWGMAVTQLDRRQKAYGTANKALPGSPVSNIVNPIGIQNIILSASELGSKTSLRTNGLNTFSANAILTPLNGTSTSNITFPMLQGMGFVTAVYSNLTPNIQSGSAILSMTTGKSPATGLFKYMIKLNDGSTWLTYVYPYNHQDPQLKLSSNAKIVGRSGFSGFIQVAKNPSGAAGETTYDASAGVYATGAALTGSVNGTSGSYSLTWTKAGLVNRHILMWALPHHTRSFSSTTATGLKNMTLTTTTKGNATAIVADSWTLVEPKLPTSLGFAPWNPKTGASTTGLSRAALNTIQTAAISELGEDMSAQSNLNSMYYSGKALAKFASILYVAKDILKNDTMVMQGLVKLEKAFSLFSTNQQQFPLVHDTAWGGIVSSASYVTHDLGADFGNTAYNDHHFHYGYFIYAAAVIGYLDPKWLTTNKAWVNSLVRDAANPSAKDNLFPVFRMFDWYHGHSWAHGLFQAGDSKDEESSSEDTNFAYAMKMWGQVIGDASMEARGNLMLSVLARSLNSYFLYQNDNDIMPANFIGNKVAGITFENKLDHTTYFGNNLEYVQGIHMLPILPHSALIRTPTFVKEEWQAFFADSAVRPAGKVAGGWRGVLYSNLALYDAKSSYKFFSQPNFNSSYLDGGASLTWYLAYAAGRGGA